MMRRLAVATACGAATLAVMTAGGDPVEVREVPEFTGIEVWDVGESLELHVHANLPRRLTVQADDPSEITTVVRGNVLVVAGASDEPVTVSVALPELERLVLWGDTHARVRAVHGQELAVTLADSAQLEAQGAVTRLELVVDARTQARLNLLTAEVARVTASGSSHVDVAVGQLLEATALGGAGVFYRGDPEVERDVRDSARVLPAP